MIVVIVAFAYRVNTKGRVYHEKERQVSDSTRRRIATVWSLGLQGAVSTCSPWLESGEACPQVGGVACDNPPHRARYRDAYGGDCCGSKRRSRVGGPQCVMCWDTWGAAGYAWMPRPSHEHTLANVCCITIRSRHNRLKCETECAQDGIRQRVAPTAELCA